MCKRKRERETKKMCVKETKKERGRDYTDAQMNICTYAGQRTTFKSWFYISAFLRQGLSFFLLCYLVQTGWPWSFPEILSSSAILSPQVYTD